MCSPSHEMFNNIIKTYCSGNSEHCQVVKTVLSHCWMETIHNQIKIEAQILNPIYKCMNFTLHIFAMDPSLECKVDALFYLQSIFLYWQL